MACYIFGAGEFIALRNLPAEDDYVIAADGGWLACQKARIQPNLLLGDFDSLQDVPQFPHVERVPVEKDDTDMMLAIKRGLALGHKEFHMYGGMGGSRTDHTIANLQSLLYLARERGILSVFCLGADAQGVTIRGGQYEVESAALSAEFPLGVSNHFVGKEIEVSVAQGSLLIGICEE